MAVAPYTLEQAEEAIADLRAQVDRMGEVHALDGSGAVVPNAQPGQAQLYSANGQPSWIAPSGMQLGTVGAQQSFFPVNTVTSILPSLGNLAAMTIPAGDAEGGAVYEIEVWGSGTQASGTRVAPEFAVVLGGTTMSTVQFGITAWSAVSQSFRWVAVGRAINHTTGAGGTWSSYLLVTTADSVTNTSPGNANFATAFSCEIASTATVDTTADQTLSVSAGWTTNAGGPTMTSRVAINKRWC